VWVLFRNKPSLNQTPIERGYPLKGYKDHWRIRVGDWRIVYTIDHAEKIVSITRVAHRREVYER
jgi:mRNA interferase RelE/StbE